ncbi:PIG-L family deacetylase [Variovorax defluvii]|uniref:PIG-L family deacetylase n=1 Tax=Variovorax defluvii TaxID=913761 RepID=A0ABP8IDK1_9BURK
MDAVRPRISPDGTPESAWAAWPGLGQLREVGAREIVPPGARAVVVAPHPDDEVLMVGGLLAQLARGTADIQVIAVTDGSASHGGSRIWPPARLRQERPKESQAALRCLGVAGLPLRLDLPDGGLMARRACLAQRLAASIEATDVVFTTWHGDGHPDHEATALACQAAAAARGARLIEVPVWAWNWAHPGDPRLPWRHALRLPLDSDATRRKRLAVQAFTSQIVPDRSTGAAPILGADMLERAARPYEVLFP